MRKKPIYLVYITDVYRRWHLVHKTNDVHRMLSFAHHPCMSGSREVKIRTI